jgi:hypothetical protein
VEEPIQDGRRQDGVAEDVTPVEEALVGGDDQTGVFVAVCVKLRETVRAGI